VSTRRLKTCGSFLLMLLMGPTILVMVLWQFHSSVSNREMSESAPPVATYLFIG
jgi:hypothetical protein